MKELNDQIKTKNFKRLYVFYGDCDYLKNIYADRIIDAALGKGDSRLMNLDSYDEKTYSAEGLSARCETAPFMANFRIIVITNSGVFIPGKQDETKKTEEPLANIPGSAIVIFIEPKVDKRIALFKTAQKAGMCIEFKKPDENDLIKWVINIAKAHNRAIAPADAAYLLQTAPNDMGILRGEIDKLIDYTYAKGAIEKADIAAIVTRSTESKIFDLTDAIGTKDLKTALDIYNALLFLKEPPILILNMMARQFKLIMACAEVYEKKKNVKDVSAATGLWDFAVKGMLKQSKNFKRETLLQAYRQCLLTDVNIKTGAISDRLGVLMLIVKYAG